jgi:drug/metabolite transporter (DMT)-like permease
MLWREPPSREAAPFLLATILVHALYFVVLGRAYQAGDLSTVYPVARGLGVALVPALAFALLGERLSPVGVTGIALVVAGVIALQLAGRRRDGSGMRAFVNPGTPWALVSGLMTASYSLIDKAGVAWMHPIPYIGIMFAGMTLLIFPIARRNPDALRREWATNRRTILAASGMTIGGYLLVLFAFRLSKTGYVVAARETSIVLSAVIGHFWLREGPLGPRLWPAAVVLAGVACVALARA